MEKVTIKHLLEAGCHFGHQTKRWNPKMKNYVYGAKNGISIIDLTKTMHQIADACNFLQRVVMDGGDVLFVGTKRQAQQIIRETAEQTNMYYVSERWLGGTLTNNITIRKSIAKMREIDKLLESDDANSLKKKELSALTRRCAKLHRDLDGIAEMKKMPGVMFIVDVCHDDIAVREARKLKIPIVAIVDTNGDPEQIDFPIAANDDAVKSIKVIVSLFTDAITIARELYHKRTAEEKSTKEREAAEKEKKARTDKENAKKKSIDDKKDSMAVTASSKDTMKSAPPQETEPAPDKTVVPAVAMSDKLDDDDDDGKIDKSATQKPGKKPTKKPDSKSRAK